MNNTMINESNDLNSMDIDWLAFQYLTDELADDVLVRFESRLASDQLAREALARAVELTQAVTIVESTTCHVAARELVACDLNRQPSGRAPAPWLVPSAWLAAAALALVVVALLWNPRTSTPNLEAGNQSVVANNDPAWDSGELAALWVRTAALLVTPELAGEGESFERMSDEELLEPLGEPIGGGSEVDTQRLQAPSWMMAALAGSADDQMQE